MHLILHYVLKSPDLLFSVHLHRSECFSAKPHATGWAWSSVTAPDAHISALEWATDLESTPMERPDSWDLLQTEKFHMDTSKSNLSMSPERAPSRHWPLYHNCERFNKLDLIVHGHILLGFNINWSKIQSWMQLWTRFWHQICHFIVLKEGASDTPDQADCADHLPHLCSSQTRGCSLR